MAFSNPVTSAVSGSTYIDGLLWGSHWGDPAAGTRLAVWIAGYNGQDEVFDFGGTPVTANNAPAENAAFAKALAVLGNVCNITFLNAASQSDADIILGTANAADVGGLGVAVPPGEDVGPLASQQGAAIINWEGYSTTNFSSLKQGGYDFISFIHEIGHALGLKHPHDQIGNNAPFPGVPDGTEFGDLGDFGLNQGLYTMMSYNDGWQTRPGGPLFDTGVFAYGYEGTPMALDVAALQYLYGVNMSYQAGNSSYRLPSANAAGAFYSCLWDAGGQDTIVNASAKSSVIDLRDATLAHAEGGGGYLSYVKGIEGGFTIAHGAIIENATGGSAADRITGNAAANVLTGNAGYDRLNGLNGADSLFGGAGRDSLSGGSGNDLLNGGIGDDYIDGGAGHDTYVGGFGADDFVTRTVLNTAEVDIIMDFGPGQGDVLAIDNFITTRLFYGAIPTRFTGAALLYVRQTGLLYTDSNGGLTGGLSLVVELANHAAITIDDILWV